MKPASKFFPSVEINSSSFASPVWFVHDIVTFPMSTEIFTGYFFSFSILDEDIKEIRLVGDYNVIDFPIANNRVEFFYAPDGAKVDYKEITKVEEIQASEYSSDQTNQLKKIGFNEFYQLYKLNELRREVELCKMAIIRG